jgi:hypothetical protein
MRMVHWLLLVSAALFISGIGFIIAGARTMRSPPPDRAPVAPSVASIKQIMEGIVMPAATVIYNAVGTTSSASGVEQTAPRNDKEWAMVGSHAAVLVESGHLLLATDRALDNGDWATFTRQLVDASNAALKAADAKSADGIFAAGGDLNESCDACHARYKRQ